MTGTCPVGAGHARPGTGRRFTAQRIVPQDAWSSAQAARCAPPSPSNRATAACACSCRPRHAEDYLELLATAEATAAELNLPIHIEGYAPRP